MYWVFIVGSTFLAAVVAEPPVPQGLYGAPGGFVSGGDGGRFPSSQYGAPGFGGGGGYSSGSGVGGIGGGLGSRDPRDFPMFTHEQDFQRPRGEIWGQWTVALPDGRVQKVEYDADDTGFHPIITYDEPSDSSGGRGNGRGYSGGQNGGFGNVGYSGGQGGYR